MDENVRARIADIEREAAAGGSRNAEALAAYTRGSLAGLVTSLAATPAPRIALISGFYVRHADPPAPETDGPVGAGLLAHLFTTLGWFVAGMTDAPCADALRTAYRSGGVLEADILIAPVKGDAAELSAWAEARAITHVIAIERPGSAANGKRYNMFGKDISKHTRAFDALFEGGSWVTAAIGDGGNEIGMGAIPRDVVAKAIENGAKIAAATSARYTLVCGVSNWGAHAIGAAMACINPAWAQAYAEVFTDAAEEALLRAVATAGAVDGVSGKREMSIDGLPMEAHRDKAWKFRTLAR